MSDEKRNWIHPLSESAKPEDDSLFVAEEQIGKKTSRFPFFELKASVQLSWPVISLGFLCIISLSFLFTFAFMSIFQDEHDGLPNEDVARVEASVTPDVEPEETQSQIREIAPVADKPTDLDTAGIPEGQGIADTKTNTDKRQVRMKEIQVFAGSKVTTYKVPVYDQPVAPFEPVSYLDESLMSRERSLRHDATPKSLIPEERTFVQALGISDPVVIMDLPVRTAVLKGMMDKPDQKLLPRRYAFAVSDPMLDLRAETTSTGFSDTIVGKTPSEILNLKAREAENLEGRQNIPNRKLLPKRYAYTVTDPVLDMGLEDISSGFNEAVMNEGADVPAQKLMPKRYAKLVDAPERLEEAPVVRTQPEARIVAPTKQKPMEENLQAWQKYAAKVPAGAAGKAKIVIIIDDMGNNPRMATLLGGLEGPLNFAFLPYAPGVKGQTERIRRQGHELLVHMPMEPAGNENPGPRALRVDLSAAELQANLDWNLTRFEGFVGINNHMGSRFTKDSDGMAMVMEELKDRGLLFLDSVTTGSSKGAYLAQQEGLPWAGRDVFLDNEIDEAAIQAQLMKVERLAKAKGLAIAIGHPHGATYRALKAWIPTLEDRGFVLVPVSSIVEFQGARKLAVGAAPEVASD